MLLHNNLEKLLVRNWTTFVDLHLLTTFVKNVVENNTFPESEAKDVVYSNSSVKIKVSTVKLENKGLELTIDFILPNKDGTVVGEMKLILEDTPVVKKLYGIFIKKK